jgi:hypothetical protein
MVARFLGCQGATRPRMRAEPRGTQRIRLETEPSVSFEERKAARADLEALLIGLVDLVDLVLIKSREPEAATGEP